MVFLQGVGVSTSIAVRIYKKYGDASISVVKNQPYRLAADVWGIGFLTADRIAQAVGIPHDSPERVKAGLQYALSQSTDQGHCFLPEEQLIADAVKLLQVDTGLVIDCLAELADEEEASSGRRCRARRAASRYRRLPGALPPRRNLPGRPAAAPAATADDRHAGLPGRGLGQGADLAGRPHRRRPRARAGGRRSGSRSPEKVAVLTGGPGCGKSFTVRSIVELARAKQAKVVLAAPTGPGREAPRRADRRRGVHRAPAAGTQAGRRRGVRPGAPAGRRPRGRRRGVDAGPAAGQQAREGRAARRPPAARRRRRPAAVASAPARCCGTCWRRAVRSRPSG